MLGLFQIQQNQSWLFIPAKGLFYLCQSKDPKGDKNGNLKETSLFLAPIAATQAEGTGCGLGLCLGGLKRAITAFD